MNLSLGAKAAWPGIWTEADDHGVFEWKPISLKAKLLPADNVDMAALLAELVTHGLVVQFVAEGKSYGVIKGFCRWQAPRRPSYRFPFPKSAELVAFNSRGCAEPEGAEAPEVPHQYGTTTGIAPEREEGGGNREREKKNPVCEESRPVAANGTHSTGRAEPIPKDWEPPSDAVAALRRTRPDLVGERYDDEMRAFRLWCRRNAVTTHDPEATWESFMRKADRPPERAPKPQGWN